MQPKTSLIKLHTKIDTKNYEIHVRHKCNPNANLIKLHRSHLQVRPDLK